MTTTSARRVLLTSVGTGVGNAALTALHRSAAAYRPIATNTEPFHSGVFRSDVCYVAPRVDREPDAWADLVLKIVEAERVQLVFPCRDAEIVPVARLRERFRRAGAEVAVPGPAIAAACVDKLATDRLLRDLGLSTPVTAAADDMAGSDEVIRTGFPVIVKPRLGTGTVGVRLVRTEDDLTSLLLRLGGSAKDWVVQEYLPIEGPQHSVTEYTELAQDREYSIQILYGADGRSRVWMSTINTLENGLPVAVRFDRSAPTIAAVEGLPCPVPGMVGPLNLQARLRAADLVFFEANTRLTGLTGARTLFGLNEVDVLWELLVEGREPADVEFRPDICVYRHLEDATFPVGALRTLTESGRWRQPTSEGAPE